jgi:hypothetical protein
MKTSMLAAVAGSLVALCAVPAAAQSISQPSLYGTLGYAFVDGGSDANFGAIAGRLGARLHPYFGVEADAAFGVDGDRTTVGTTSVKTELKHSFAGYGVGFLPVAPNVDLLARVGYGTSKVGAKSGAISASSSEESWNYGVGAQYAFDGVNGIRGDYTRYDFNNGGGKADVWAVSYVRKF